MILKYLVPFERFVIEGPLSCEDAIVFLQKDVGPGRFWPQSGDGRDFQGEIDGNRFRIRRVIGYRNSFLPVVVGALTPISGGCVVRGHMRLHVWGMIFCVAWLSALASFLVALTRSWSADPSGFSLEDLLPLGIFLAGLGITNGGFWSEAIKQKTILQAIFQRAI